MLVKIEALLQFGHPLGLRESDPLRPVFLKADGLDRLIGGELEALGIIDSKALMRDR